jgi:hypothetical protein
VEKHTKSICGNGSWPKSRMPLLNARPGIAALLAQVLVAKLLDHLPLYGRSASSMRARLADASRRSDFQCHDGLGFEERLQSQQSELSTGTRLLVAAERRKRVVLHPVDSHASCLEPTCHCLCSR